MKRKGPGVNRGLVFELSNEWGGYSTSTLCEVVPDIEIRFIFRRGRQHTLSGEKGLTRLITQGNVNTDIYPSFFNRCSTMTTDAYNKLIEFDRPMENHICQRFRHTPPLPTYGINRRINNYNIKKS